MKVGEKVLILVKVSKLGKDYHGLAKVGKPAFYPKRGGGISRCTLADLSFDNLFNLHSFSILYHLLAPIQLTQIGEMFCSIANYDHV